MAVTLSAAAGATKRYLGMSTDIKPGDDGQAVALAEGTEFLEWDTGRRFVRSGGAWQLQPIGLATSADVARLEAIDLDILSELRKIRSGWERYLQDEFTDPES